MPEEQANWRCHCPNWPPWETKQKLSLSHTGHWLIGAKTKTLLPITIQTWKHSQTSQRQCLYPRQHSRLSFSQTGQHARLKARILSLHHPTLKQLLTNPEDISNTFSNYYASLYNLKHDPHTPQPTEALIHNFLPAIDLMAIQTLPLESLTVIKIHRANTALPLYKSPVEVWLILQTICWHINPKMNWPL